MNTDTFVCLCIVSRCSFWVLKWWTLVVVKRCYDLQNSRYLIQGFGKKGLWAFALEWNIALERLDLDFPYTFFRMDFSA